MFYCLYNAHADITRIVDENGELAEKYYYDEWGVETETLRYGDITGDGEVNINDYSLMKRLILLSDTEQTAEQKIVSDLNADGKVDKDDVNILKQILFGNLKYCPADTNKDGFINEKTTSSTQDISTMQKQDFITLMQDSKALKPHDSFSRTATAVIYLIR